MGAPRRNAVHYQFVENALELVRDGIGELCGRSTDANVKNIKFCGQETVGDSAKIAKALDWRVVLGALRYDTVILARSNLSKRKRRHNNDGRRSKKKTGSRPSVLIESTKLLTESHHH